MCIISALFHDIASITDYKLYEEHHMHGAKIASFSNISIKDGRKTK